MSILKKLFPEETQTFISPDSGSRDHSLQYRRLWLYTVLITAFVSLLPLIIMTVVNYYQYRKAFQDELRYRVERLTTNTKRTLEHYLTERIAALTFIINDNSFEELCHQEKLSTTFKILKKSIGGFIDLGVIDSDGSQCSYAGPYALEGKNYKGQDWFHEISFRGVYVSDVFMGYRKFPHLVIAVKHERNNDDFHVLRATIDVEVLNVQISLLGLKPFSDAFIINREGVLQTSSRFFGKVLQRFPLSIPPISEKIEVIDPYEIKGEDYLMGYTYISQSPFIFLVVKHHATAMQNWFTLRTELIGFFAVSMIIILLLIMGFVSYMTRRIREADQKKATAFHNIEYTSKLASIGRLAAGVAHEINNPTAIINEKAGLVKDLVSFTPDFPRKEKMLKLINSILHSVERIKNVTHRLLGFAKHMDIQAETINLDYLLKEVLGFLEKETEFRNIKVFFHISDNLPTIESDRGQLQQVFLNILNNALQAVADNKGEIDIVLEEKGTEKVEIAISDNGPGIPEETLKFIFEPFFTTKKGYGTGLGLSITYGIVKKLDGDIFVTSQVGKGTSFTVSLPVKRPNI
ncbi:ATP-binding protein [candidate division CSSED10-310 bacterium]|uniref:histidine kinase n=1 Tax=candidate division CSSED10-310 bacterium TaxID=2855610 RepID=A0ABV6Z2A1_UNCC1